MKKKVLVIDDDVDLCLLLSRYLRQHQYEVETATTGSNAMEQVKEKHFDLVLCDYQLDNGITGKDMLQEIRKADPLAVVLIITAYSDVKTAGEVLKMGAHDYITKPIVPAEILAVLNNAVRLSSNEMAVSGKEEQKKEEAMIAGVSEPFKVLQQQVEIVALKDCNMLLYGENGSGREMIARTIHQNSRRKNKPFIVADCGSLAAEEENKLMTYVEQANGGTLFLDEVIHLPDTLQLTLLNLLQHKKNKKAAREKEMNVRAIAASDTDLQETYLKGAFREDLYYFLNEFIIQVPPLRERKEDIPLFAAFFLKKIRQELDKPVDDLEGEIMELLMQYRWPGNIRELKNVVRKAVVLAEGHTISRKELPAAITG